MAFEARRVFPSIVLGGHHVRYGTAAPTTGPWLAGDVVFASHPTANGPTRWVCVTSGTPGTWIEVGTQPYLWHAAHTRTITGTALTSQLDPAGIGTLVFPADFWTVGKQVSFRSSGYVSAGNGIQSRYRITLGGVSLVDVTGTLPNGLNQFFAEAVFEFRCVATGSSGSVIGSGRTLFQAAAGVAGSSLRPLVMIAAASVDLSVASAFGVDYQFVDDNAANALVWTTAALTVM